jgi:DNA-binding CsgD family transcriptional regulator
MRQATLNRHPPDVIIRDFRHLRATELTSEGRLLVLSIAVFATVALLAGIDVGADLREGTTVDHVIVEGSIVAAALFGALLLARRLLGIVRAARQAQQESSELAAQLEVTREEARRWREEAKELLSGLGAALERQFERWGLSPAEKEVALLLLKGLSHKEIADARAISEATARQQARAVYRKAGLAGRNELAAFFLEDLLLPDRPS